MLIEWLRDTDEWARAHAALREAEGVRAAAAALLNEMSVDGYAQFTDAECDLALFAFTVEHPDPDAVYRRAVRS